MRPHCHRSNWRRGPEVEQALKDWARQRRVLLLFTQAGRCGFQWLFSRRSIQFFLINGHKLRSLRYWFCQHVCDGLKVSKMDGRQECHRVANIGSCLSWKECLANIGELVLCEVNNILKVVHWANTLNYKIHQTLILFLLHRSILPELPATMPPHCAISWASPIRAPIKSSSIRCVNIDKYSDDPKGPCLHIP